MDAILSTFGIDWRLLLVNAINFGLLLAGLTFFLYKPLGKMLEERRKRVTQGVKDAEAAKVVRAEIEASRAEKLAAAGREADMLLSQASKTGTEKGRAILAEAEKSAARALAEAEAQSAELKAQAIRESKEELAKLIVLGIEKTALKTK